MRDYFKSQMLQFAGRAFDSGRFLEVGTPMTVCEQYDYIFVRDEKDIEKYISRLAEGGIIAGHGYTNYFGDDVTRVEKNWFHVKPTTGKLLFTPVILTLDRTKEAVKEMDKWGIDYELFGGIKHKAGHIGCGKSYVSLFYKYPGRDVLVLEDDVKFIRNPFTFSLEGLPDDWDAVYLGANLRDYCKPVNHRFCRVVSAWTTHAILWNKKLTERVRKEYDPERGVPIDEWLRKLDGVNLYVTKPFYATQKDGHSTIVGMDVTYPMLFQSQNRLV